PPQPDHPELHNCAFLALPFGSRLRVTFPGNGTTWVTAVWAPLAVPTGRAPAPGTSPLNGQLSWDLERWSCTRAGQLLQPLPRLDGASAGCPRQRAERGHRLPTLGARERPVRRGAVGPAGLERLAARETGKVLLVAAVLEVESPHRRVRSSAVSTTPVAFG